MIDLASVLKELHVFYSFLLAVIAFSVARHLANHKSQDELRRFTVMSFSWFGSAMLFVTFLVAMLASVKAVLPPKSAPANTQIEKQNSDQKLPSPAEANVIQKQN